MEAYDPGDATIHDISIYTQNCLWMGQCEVRENVSACVHECVSVSVRATVCVCVFGFVCVCVFERKT